MSWLGAAMFAVAMAVMVATALPIYAVLLGTAAAFAALGVAIGAFEWPILGALPNRVVGLLEHDLLQALPLFALIGALLNRLPVAALLHAAGMRLFARCGAASQLSALGVGALIAPMNGSVGASLYTLSRRIAPRLAHFGVTPEETAATLCVASTLGIVIPPSLVLLLLGDAMMRAHTEAANASHVAVQIVNTQDIVRAALVPGLAVLAAALAIAAWRGRGRRPPPSPLLKRGEWIEASVVTLAIVALMGSVAAGMLYAVEAAASGAVALFAWALIARRLDRPTLLAVLADAMTLTGLLMALLVAATSFSLVLRAFGTDSLVAAGLEALAPTPTLLAGAVLLIFAGCSFVLDAFEMIFLVVPLVMPPVLIAVPDAAWVAAVTLLVLQAGFLLPPFGYAVVMSRRLLAAPPALASLARALAPNLAAQALVVAGLVAWPSLAHLGQAPAKAAPALSEQDIERLMNEASRSNPRP
jgi:TRAP-type mannitol/chloroaromatic compound transport system permease large subunit